MTGLVDLRMDGWMVKLWNTRKREQSGQYASKFEILFQIVNFTFKVKPQGNQMILMRVGHLRFDE